MHKLSMQSALLGRVVAVGLVLGIAGVAVDQIHERHDVVRDEALYAMRLASSIMAALPNGVTSARLRTLARDEMKNHAVRSVILLAGDPLRVSVSSTPGWQGRTIEELNRLLGGQGVGRSDAASGGSVFHDAHLDRNVYSYPITLGLAGTGPELLVIEFDARAQRYALWKRSLIFMSEVFVLLGLLSVAIRWAVRKYAVQPLVEISRAVERQTAGDEEALLPAEFTTAEFSEFGGLLNEMIHTRIVAHRELQRSESELRLLGQITRIADRAEDFDEALRSCCAQICRFLLWPLGHVYVLDEDDRSLLRPSNIWHVSCPELAAEFVSNTSMVNFREGEDLSGRVLERKEPVWVEDCWAEEWFTRSMPGTSMIRAAAGFPIFMNQQVVAVLELFDVNPREREVRPVALMHNIGLTLGHVLQRRQGHELLVRRNRELVEAMQVAVSATNAKSEFLANMSHEIRTPLTAILGYAELIDSAETAAERKEYSSTIQRNGEHLLELINDILDVSKIEAGRLEVERIDCSSADLIRGVVDAVSPRAREKNLEFLVRNNGPVPARIVTDPTRLHQVLLNLTSNAVKFTLTGRVELMVELETAPDDPNPLLRFTVNDTGIGIRPDQLEKIFRPFSQADMSTTRRFGGTGLGLSISQNLIKLLGGELHAESTEGGGSIFRFSVETGPLEGVEMIERLGGSQGSMGGVVPLSREIRLDGLNILLAEDGIDNQKLIIRILSKVGAKVDVAENGALACERALEAATQNQPFDVILMDMQMPVMDGYAATVNLRQQGHTGPIIALTANAMKGDREKCLRAGCDDFVSKPVKKSRLIGAVAAASDHG